MFMSYCVGRVFLAVTAAASVPNGEYKLSHDECAVYYHGGGKTYQERWAVTGIRDSEVLKRVYEWNPKSGEEGIVYETQNDLFKIQVSKCLRIAFLEILAEDYWVISVIDANGNLLFQVEQEESIVDFSWNPEGTKIAYIGGRRKIYAPNSVDSSGVWVYDIDAKESKKIADTGHALEWPSFDNCLYIDVKPGTRDHSVLRYNPRSEVLEQADFLAVDFSPDGKYYLHFSDGSGFQVFRRETNELVRKLPSGTDLTQILMRWGVCSWLTSHTLYLPINRRVEDTIDRRHLVLDLSTGELIKTQGRPIDSWGSNSVIVIYSNGKLDIEDISAMEFVSAQNIIETIEPHPML